ncbi:hypothetical protein BDZ97DRAFT_221475 [Flammula alnicola]|nr:hypothetical protein BDZ97DRAFT_221475 [Flammula alnicola]
MPPVPILASAQGSWTFPTLKLRVDDLEHKGVDVFFGAINPKEVLRRAVEASFKWLYTPETTATNVEEILLVLKSMDGVAHTSGSPTHKQIHFSLDYIVDTQDRAEHEITGVLVHEVVHCFQHNANNTCPGGLIEGIADYVRLKEGLAPPHWEKGAEITGKLDMKLRHISWIG